MGQALGCFQVSQSTVAIKEQFGRYDGVLEPGCHFVPWCVGTQVKGLLSLRVHKIDVRCETKTKDNVFVTVVASVQFRALAEKAQDAFYKLSNTKEQIQAYVFDVLRASVPKMELDAVFEQKNIIAKTVEQELEKAMSAYGYEIVGTLIVVKKAMNEINAAARLRVATNDKAEAEKILQIKKAEGEAESKFLHGLGIARQRQAIVDGLRDSVLNFSDHVPGTTSKDVMDMVLVTQYFDTTSKDIIPNCYKFGMLIYLVNVLIRSGVFKTGQIGSSHTRYSEITVNVQRQKFGSGHICQVNRVTCQARVLRSFRRV